MFTVKTKKDTVKAQKAKAQKAKAQKTKAQKTKQGIVGQLTALLKQTQGKGKDCNKKAVADQLWSIVGQKTTIKITKAQDHQIKHLSTSTLLDMSGSMTWGARFMSLCKILATLRSLHENQPVKLRGFGEQKINDTRNYMFNGTLGNFVDSGLLHKRAFNSATYTTSISGSLKEMDPQLLVFIGDGDFDDGQFSRAIDDLLQSGWLKNLQCIVMLFPSGVPDETVDSLARALSAVLKKVTSRMINLEIVKPKDNDSKLGTVINESRWTVRIPDNQVLLGGSDGIVVPKTATPKDIAATLQTVNDKLVWKNEILHLIGVMLRLARVNPSILLKGQYAKVHAILGNMKNLSIDGYSVQQLYFDKFSDIKGKALTEDKNALSQLIAMAQRMSSSKIDIAILRVLCKKLMFIVPYKDGKKVDKETLDEMVRKAISDKSGYYMHELLKIMFHRSSKVNERADYQVMTSLRGGLMIPDPKMCADNDDGDAWSYRTALLKSLQNFFQILGKDFTQPLGGGKLFMTLLYILSSRELEIPDELREMIKHVIFCPANPAVGAKYLTESLGLNVKKKEPVLKDEFYTGMNAFMLYNLFVTWSSIIPKNKTLAATKPYICGIYKTYKMKHVLDSLLSTKYGITSVKPDADPTSNRTIVLLPHANQGGYNDPAVRLPSAFIGGIQSAINLDLNLSGLSGCIPLTYIDNPFNKETLQIVKAHAETLIGTENSKQRKKITAFVNRIHKPLGTDVVHLSEKKLVILGQVSEDQYKPLLEHLMQLFTEWKVADMNRLSTPDTLASDLLVRKEREDIIRKLVSDCNPPMKEVTHDLNANETKELVLQVYPHLQHVFEMPSKRVAIEKAFENLTEKGAFGDVQPNTVQDPNMQKVVDIYRKEMEPQPGSESASSLDCQICLDSFTRQNRAWFPCGHAMCKACHTRYCRKILQEIETIDQLPLAKCACPTCRQYCILTKDAKFDEIHTFFNDGNKIEDKGIYKYCQDCNKVFCSGYKDCQDHSGALRDKCEDCTKVQYFECPECGVKCQHGGGCDMMRCCGLGYHCPAERGLDCDHRFCDCPYPCQDPDHSAGCGHTWNIGVELRGLGNGGPGLTQGRVQQLLEDGAG